MQFGISNRVDAASTVYEKLINILSDELADVVILVADSCSHVYFNYFTV